MNKLNTIGNDQNILENNQNIINSLKEKFGENIRNGIEKEISKTEIEGLKKLNEKIGGDFISSCFHPDEFTIGAYRPTSVINILELSEKIGVKPEIEYLDSLSKNSYGIKGFPNIKVGKNKPTMVNQILKSSREEKTIREYLKESDEIFNSILNSSLKNNQINEETIKYLDNIFKELEVLEEIENFLEKNSFTEKDKKLFKNFILGDKISEALKEIKDIFTKKILQEKYKENISQNEIYAELQNSILTLIFDKYYPEYKQKLQENNFYNKSGLNLKISYNNSENTKKYQDSLKIILEEKDLGSDFFIKYFEKLLERSGGRPVEIFSYGENGRDNEVFIWKDNGNLKFIEKTGKNNTEISEKEFFDKIINTNLKINFSGAIIILLSCLGGQFHIGSERGIREVIAQTVEENFKEKGILNENTKNYINKVISGLSIFDTFVEGGDNSGKNLAGSCGTLPEDMLKMLFIGGDFAKDQLEKAKNKNDEIPEINKNLLLKSLENCIKSTYNKIQDKENPKKDEILKKFFELNEKYSQNKNIENFLELVSFCFKLDKFL